jgi:inosose dehydratase
MPRASSRFRFACAPVSWGIQDFRDAAWQQPYDRVLAEISGAGYTGTELGPYGYLPTKPADLRRALNKRRLKLLSAFVPVPLAEPAKATAAIEHVRKVGALLAKLKAPLIVLSDSQTPECRQMAGRVPADGSRSLKAGEWRRVGKLVGEIERVAKNYGLRTVFHPHVATHVETPLEVERLFEALGRTGVGLCLDTGHCVYGGGDPSDEARKYKARLRYVHIKDINAPVLGEVRRKQLNFEQAVAAGVFSQIGKGCIDFQGFFAVLNENDYHGWMIVEQDVTYGKTVVPPVESMRESLRYLHTIVSNIEIFNS